MKTHFFNLLIAIGIIVGIAELSSRLTITTETALSKSKLAEQVVSTCSTKSYRPACYDEEIPKLMDTISMEEAFMVTRIIQDKDPEYSYCHILGHNLSAREVQKDPSKWKDVVSRCPSGMCSNGCIHGGFQERFRTEFFENDEDIERVKPDLKTICEARDNWHPTGLEQASCYHALGHLTMYVTNAEIKKSIALCEEVAKKEGNRDFRQLCYDGAFMQIFQPLEPEDFALIKGKEIAKEKLESFCDQFQGRVKGSCWTEGWPLYHRELQEPQGLVDYCSKTSPAEQNRCYNALIYVMTAQFKLNKEKITSYCNGLPAERQGNCFANAASRIIEVDYRNVENSIAVCTAAQNENTKKTCFDELAFYASYNFHPDSPESKNLCNALPSPWKENCPRKISNNAQKN